MKGADLKAEDCNNPSLEVVARECFTNMRITHPDHFDTFVEVALVGFVAIKDWRNKAALVPLSEIFTITDEAFAMLALENQINDLVKLMEKGALEPTNRSIPVPEGKDSTPRYMKMEVKGPGATNHKNRYRPTQIKSVMTSQLASRGRKSVIDNVFQGWSPQRFVRYNLLRHKVEELRKHEAGIQCQTRNMEFFKKLSDMKEIDADEEPDIDDDLQGGDDESGFDEFSEYVMFTAV